MASVYLGLGSNLGNREANLRAALRGLARMGRVEAVSALYESEAVGGGPFDSAQDGPAQPPYLNAVCQLETGLEPRPLLRYLLGLERELGRRPGGKCWAARPIDLDILLHGDRVVDEAGLVIPHARMMERSFVLAPLAELAADVRHPVEGKTVGELLAAVGTEGVRRIAEAGWDGLAGSAGEKLRI